MLYPNYSIAQIVISGHQKIIYLCILWCNFVVPENGGEIIVVYTWD